MKYRKKPVVIDAMQWDGTNVSETREFFGDSRDLSFFGDSVAISTQEGEMNASPGDWIIRGVKGEFYPCKPDIFALTYEGVN